MLAVSIHFKKKRIILVLLALIIIAIICSVTLRGINSSKNISESDYNNNYNRIGYLNLCGWDVEETPISQTEVTIPTEFNARYNQYNDIQLRQGYNLGEYKGKNAEIFKYKVSNYGKEDKEVMAELLIFDGKIIGGTIFENQQNGFQCGLNETP